MRGLLDLGRTLGSLGSLGRIRKAENSVFVDVQSAFLDVLNELGGTPSDVFVGAVGRVMF
jgi:hypothetical protein